MRVNSNKKIHKMKRDPYKTLLRTAGILAIVVRSRAITFPPATALKTKTPRPNWSSTP